MGCNSSKAFKEKDAATATTAQSSTVVGSPHTSEKPLSSHKENLSPPTPTADTDLINAAPTKKGYGYSSSPLRGVGSQTYSQPHPNTYLAPPINPTVNTVSFSPLITDCGPAAGEGCSDGGGHGGESGYGGDGGASSSASAGVSSGGGFSGGGFSF